MLIGILLCPALTNATPSVISDQQKKAIIADNSALLSEIDGLNKTIRSERQQTATVIYSLNKVISADAAMLQNLQDTNNIILQQIEALNAKSAAQAKIQRGRNAGNFLIGIGTGIVIGMIINK